MLPCAPRSRSAGVLVMAAAVADWRPRDVARNKLKKGADTLSIELVPTVDILRTLRDDGAANGVFVVGFAAETENMIENARAKLDAKQLDLVVVNDVSRAGIGMGADDNEVTIIGRDGTLETIARAPKPDVADAIVRIIASRNCDDVRVRRPRDPLAAPSRLVHVLDSRRPRRVGAPGRPRRDPLRQAIDSRLRRRAHRGVGVRGGPRDRRRHRRAPAHPRPSHRPRAADRGSILRTTR